jgi:beta-galactosidase
MPCRISKDAATIQVKTTIKNNGETDLVCTLASSILDGDGSAVQSTESIGGIDAEDTYQFVQQMQVPNPMLWSVDNPYLYSAHVTVLVQDRIMDARDIHFGIREAVFDADTGFLLNGSRVKLNGVCLHHDGGCVGAAVPERVWARRLEILKEIGCNAIRTSHNPYAAEFLDLCDRMGFLVMNEILDEWKVPKGQIRGNGYSNHFNEWYERDVENFVKRDRNHPSVVLWSAGNEIGDQSDPKGAETLRKLMDIFHHEDPTRPVTVGCDQIMSEPPSNAARPEFLSQLDIVGYNYVDRWRDRVEKYYSIDHQDFRGRRFIGTESGSMGGTRGEYGDLFPDTASPRFGGFARSRNIDVEQLWKFVRKQPVG